MLSRLTRMRSNEAEEATHFGPRSHDSACAMCAVARSSARKRRKVALATVAAKPGGNLRPAAISTSANMSAGRRPVK